MNKETMGQPAEGTNGASRARERSLYHERERHKIEHIHDIPPREWIGMFPDGTEFIHSSDPLDLMEEGRRYGLHVARQEYFAAELRDRTNGRCA